MEKITFKSVAHLYLGCKIYNEFSDGSKGSLNMNTVALEWIITDYKDEDIKPIVYKPIIRKLDSMTEYEAEHLVWLIMDHYKLGDDCRVSKEELDIYIHHNDGGLLVDEDAIFVIEVSCRCYVGQIGVYPNGDLKLCDDDGKMEPIQRISEIMLWMLQQDFDLFSLIENNEAIDINKK